GLSIDKETLATQFRLHLHRGIGYLAGDPNIKKLEDLILGISQIIEDRC
ncbi:MAG: DndE family protein, partial [Pseudanabaena sp.]